MGSRAVVDRLPGRGRGAASGSASSTGELGIVYTRTGRRFFNDAELEAAFLDRVRARARPPPDFWDELDTDWVCLDCELMPWSAKAQELLRDPVRRGRRRRRGCAAAAAVARPGAGGAATGRERPSSLADSGADAARRRRPVRRRLPAVLLAGRRRSPT